MQIRSDTWLARHRLFFFDKKGLGGRFSRVGYLIVGSKIKTVFETTRGGLARGRLCWLLRIFLSLRLLRLSLLKSRTVGSSNLDRWYLRVGIRGTVLVVDLEILRPEVTAKC